MRKRLDKRKILIIIVIISMVLPGIIAGIMML